jgi:hypothetical protein
MAAPQDVSDLEAQRSALHAEFAHVGDFRPGSLSAVMRRCGKPNCVCADPTHRGHGPQHMLTKKIDGKTVSLHLKAGPGLDKVATEVANYKHFKETVGQIVEVSETICDARPASPLADTSVNAEDLAAAEKGGSRRPSPRRSRRR